MAHDWYCYIVECADSSLYTGITNDLATRIKKHNDGVGAKYTRSRRPVKLAFLERYANRSQAAKREYEIKQMTREEKIGLILTRSP
jgi:putative endonuclease